MKRLLCLLLPLFMLGCQEIETEMADIKSRLISLEGTAIASIQDQVSSIQKTIEALQEARTELGEEDTRLEGLITKLQTYVNESLSNETDWVKATYCTLEQYQAVSDEVATLGENLTNVESTLKSWVGEALTGYYDIATMDAKLSALATTASVQEEIGKVKTIINQAKEELTSAYKKAISDAITQNNGVIDSKIAEEIGTVQSRIDSEVATLNEKITNLENRVKALEDLVAGLKVSDSIFGFVLYTQKDTITKGLKFPITFRVNPSGIPFTQDMVVLDNMSSTKYLVEEITKASYITESKNFYADSLGKTRNAANEETDGQYFLRLGTRETRNLIDDNLFSLVGAYRDKADVVQYVSSNPFQLVMMPTPEEGLYPWLYAHGNATRLAQRIIPAVPAQGDIPAQEGKSYLEEELGSITFSLDSRSYKQENGDARQTYSARKYIRTLSFEGNSKEDSIVLFQAVKDSGFVRFIPDTSKAVWAALMDTTKLTSLKVKGKINAVDRFGGSSSFPVEMTWYSRHRDTLDVTKKVSDFYDAEGNKQPVSLDLQSEFEKMGYYYSEAGKARRKALESFVVTGNTGGGRINFRPDVEADERQYVTAKISTIGRKENLPGVYTMTMVNDIKSIPAEDDPGKSEEQIMAVLTIRLTITAD